MPNHCEAVPDSASQGGPSKSPTDAASQGDLLANVPGSHADGSPDGQGLSAEEHGGVPAVSGPEIPSNASDAPGRSPNLGAGEFYPVVGVGPHPEPWPTGEQWDEELLANGDRRNVVDRYRYWKVEAIRADLDRSRTTLHVAIENWQHDLNIGSIVRTANAFNVAAVHIVGKRDWNRRGAMVTDRYLQVMHHPSVAEFSEWAADASVSIVGIEQAAGSKPLTDFVFPRACALLLGNEGLGLTPEAVAACTALVEIPQSGSTRSINASAAGAIAMWEWWRQGAV